MPQDAQPEVFLNGRQTETVRQPTYVMQESGQVEVGEREVKRHAKCVLLDPYKTCLSEAANLSWSMVAGDSAPRHDICKETAR